MNNIRGRIAMAVLQHRVIASLLFLAVTLFFAAGLKNVRLETIFSDLLPKDDPFIHVFKDHPNFGNPLTFTLMVKNKNKCNKFTSQYAVIFRYNNHSFL